MRKLRAVMLCVFISVDRRKDFISLRKHFSLRTDSLNSSDVGNHGISRSHRIRRCSNVIGELALSVFLICSHVLWPIASWWQDGCHNTKHHSHAQGGKRQSGLLLCLSSAKQEIGALWKLPADLPLGSGNQIWSHGPLCCKAGWGGGGGVGEGLCHYFIIVIHFY